MRFALLGFFQIQSLLRFRTNLLLLVAIAREVRLLRSVRSYPETIVFRLIYILIQILLHGHILYLLRMLECLGFRARALPSSTIFFSFFSFFHSTFVSNL